MKEFLRLKEWALSLNSVDLEYKRKVAECNTLEELDEVIVRNVADSGRLNLVNLARLMRVWNC